MAVNLQAGYYPTTIWSTIERARHADSEAAFEALGGLIEKYYPPLQAHLVREFHVSEDEAADWLQSFIWKKVLLKNLFAEADPARGKFRTFLLRALLNFVRDQLEHDRRRRRAPEGGFSPMEELEESLPAPDPGSGKSMDAAWAQAVLTEALRQMESECARKGNQRVWQVFRLRLAEPLKDGSEPMPYAELTQRLGFRDDIEAGNALITAKRMFARVLRSVVAEYCRTGAEVEKEIAELRSILAES